ncbi:MAG: hypothetical protein ACOYZ6_01985 [Chloroflexota bacterium]
MSRLDNQVSLKINRPHTSILARAAILFVLACLLAELLTRAPFVQAVIPYQAYGTNHTQLELQLNILDQFVRENGAPDCFIFGSSQAFREMDPQVFAQSFESASGERITCYNFGVTGSQIWSTSILNKILVEKYHPRLVVIGTSYLDYTEGREFQIDERFKDNDWLQYQTNSFTLDGLYNGWFNGWLTEHSYAWRALNLFSYAAPFGMRYGEVLREARKWDGEIAGNGFALSEKFINPNLPVEEGFVKNLMAEFGNYGVSERNLSALEEIIAVTEQAGAQVMLAEMTYHPALLELRGPRGTVREGKEDILAFIAKVNARLDAIVSEHGIIFLHADPSVAIPEDGWFDLYHLNRIGAGPFSAWLGQEAGRVLDPLPSTSEGE